MRWLIKTGETSQQQITTTFIVLAAAIFGALYYLGYIKLPETSQPQSLPKEKTAEELVIEYRTKLINGELAVINGEVVGIENAALTIFAVRSGETITGLMVADNVIVRLVEVTGTKSPDVPAATPEKFVAFNDVKPGDQVRAYVLPDNKILMMDKLNIAATSTPTTMPTQAVIGSIVAPTEVAIGPIVKIDGRTIYLVVDQRQQKEVAIKIDDATTFQKVHHPLDAEDASREVKISFSDLRAGDNVAVTFSGNVALAVLITSSQ